MQNESRVKKLLTWEGFILFILLVDVFFIQWLSLTFYYNVVVDAVLVFYLILHRNSFRNLKLVALIFIIYLLYFALQAIRPGAQIKVLLKNLLPVTTSVLIVITLSTFWGKTERTKKSLKALFPYINAYMILNIPVLLLQVRGHYELSGRHADTISASLNADLISGLFGYYGTPMLAMFASFFFVYDFWYFRHYVKKSYKKIYVIYYILMLAFYIYIARPSANYAFYLVLVLFFVYYMLSVDRRYIQIIRKMKGKIKLISLLGVAALSIILSYGRIELITNIIDRYILTFNSGKSSLEYFGGGSYVRFGMLNYFFNSDINKLVGAGIGTVGWKEDYSFGFKNFGQSDMGSFLILGGLLFVLLLLIMITLCTHKGFRSSFMEIIGCALLLIIMIYTQPFTTMSIIISYMLFMLVCGIESKSPKKDAILKSIMR